MIISGGPDSVYNENAPVFDPALFDMGIPILGICYGMQLMVHRTNEGKIERQETREDGQFNIMLENKSLLFSDLDTTQKVLLTHGDSVTAPGNGFAVTSRSCNINIEMLVRKVVRSALVLMRLRGYTTTKVNIVFQSFQMKHWPDILFVCL